MHTPAASSVHLPSPQTAATLGFSTSIRFNSVLIYGFRPLVTAPHTTCARTSRRMTTRISSTTAFFAMAMDDPGSDGGDDPMSTEFSATNMQWGARIVILVQAISVLLTEALQQGSYSIQRSIAPWQRSAGGLT